MADKKRAKKIQMTHTKHNQMLAQRIGKYSQSAQKAIYKCKYSAPETKMEKKKRERNPSAITKLVGGDKNGSHRVVKLCKMQRDFGAEFQVGPNQIQSVNSQRHALAIWRKPQMLQLLKKDGVALKRRFHLHL
ncbi:60S ribosomal protein L6-like [Sceloporus undulatus]|uniref:60S ribosomal protein L6-like n=1 Tax=Sceloporus undulatus TaxID=8520 RepID=UPI001C4B7711|nr:60S ribosomal protein L6-like [Sceloporus undulatus]